MPHRISADDQAFRAAFETGAMAPAEFDHSAHVRLAYVLLCQWPAEQAAEAMTRALRAYLAHHGIDPAKYHATLTRAWILAVHHGMADAEPPCDSAAAFLARHPQLLDRHLLLTHYSTDRLFSPAAREGFLAPDLQPIPPR